MLSRYGYAGPFGLTQKGRLMAIREVADGCPKKTASWQGSAHASNSGRTVRLPGVGNT